METTNKLAQPCTVTWSIELNAKTPTLAAREALDCIVNGTAKIFDVAMLNKRFRVDLTEGTTTELTQEQPKPEQFPNGFDAWRETYHDVVAHLTENIDNEGHMAYKQEQQWGKGGMYDLANELTNRFEEQNKGVEWGTEKDYHDTLEAFLDTEDKTYI